MRSLPKLKVLFLGMGNFCRSQMAEGWARHLKGDVIEPYVAGIAVHGLNPLAVKRHYRRVRDEIRPFVLRRPDVLSNQPAKRKDGHA